MIERPGGVCITLRGDVRARLFAVPFLLVGGWLGWHLAGSLFDLVVGRAALSEMLAGTVLLAVVTAAFAVPGVLLAFGRAQVEIDRQGRTVTTVRDFRFWRSTERRALAEFERVEVDRLSIAPDRPSRGRAFQVELAGDDRPRVVVGLFDDGEAALAHGRRLGALLGLPVDDRRFTER
jgi:hypothetical protein